MRKAFIGVCLFGLVTIIVSGQEGTVTLDKGIKGSMLYLVERLDPDTKVAVLNFSADPAVSNYVIEELTANLVNGGNFIVVDRSELELLQREMNFQLSGEVSDESAQSIGKRLGAQTIISGSLSPLGNRWRMRIKALEVETAKIQGIQAYTIKRDTVLSSLLQPKVAKRPKTTGEKIGTGAVNIILGLGSYLEGDITGGLTLTAGYAVAAGLFVIEATALDWDNPAVGVPATIGITVAGATIVYGIVRPFIYNRNPKIATLLDNMHFDIAPVSVSAHDIFHGAGFRLGYTLRF
ncbi:CsgG/HfaB family protein [Treponema primitia]|uniref:CsgG/HfaB family protein n=1 Tax=Treponema primitia TaxID=88058 RepID=UPI0002554D94|nr:CsgG/HfaB family protein [Treponema primitia]